MQIVHYLTNVHNPTDVLFSMCGIKSSLILFAVYYFLWYMERQNNGHPSSVASYVYLPPSLFLQWEKSLCTFCEDEFSVKTSHYSCCKKHGSARWDCFEERAPDPLYQPSEDQVPTSMVLPPTIQGFEFNPSSCQKTRYLSLIHS